MLASAHYAHRSGLTRPFARDTAQHRRMGHKLSIGLILLCQKCFC
jgi:hypothetical protein